MRRTVLATLSDHLILQFVKQASVGSIGTSGDKKCPEFRCSVNVIR